jgi:Anti-anti-sigma regulatory factor (antagonist of anti-sigma factor)
MTVAALTRDGCTLLTVHGEVDIATEGRLIASASDAMQTSGGRPVILDLSMLTFLSSSGFGHLVALDERARADGVPLRIVVGDAWAVFRPFAVMGLEEVLALFRTVEDAIEADPAPDV